MRMRARLSPSPAQAHARERRPGPKRRGAGAGTANVRQLTPGHEKFHGILEAPAFLRASAAHSSSVSTAEPFDDDDTSALEPSVACVAEVGGSDARVAGEGKGNERR